MQYRKLLVEIIHKMQYIIMDEIKQQSKFDEYLYGIFMIESSHRLEQKAWFRLLRIIQGITIVLIIFFSIAIGFVLQRSETIDTATLSCIDGTKWSAMDPKDPSSELDSSEKCGLCYKRTDGSNYNACTSRESAVKDSYMVERTYKPMYSHTQYILYPILGMVVALSLLKLIVRGFIYVVAGNKN
jgi:hypothetical protein